MADGLSVAASIIAVVDVSVKVITLCSQYSKAVANASADISRLQTLVKGLKTTLDHAEALIKGPQGAALSTSHDLQDHLAGCQSTLQQLHAKLEMGVARQAKRRVWTRALKWPFSHGEIEATMSTIERYHRRIMDGLQVDQTTLLLHIKDGVDRIPVSMNEAASIARKPHFVVPFPRDPDFVPRPVIQTEIHGQFRGNASRLALIGLGGFGKSQLAVELAHGVRHSTPEKSVFWLHGRSRATFEESYRSLADKLALPRRHDPQINILALVRDWLQREDVAPWLIILDNADDFDVFFGGSDAAPLASYLPKTNNGKVLVTSRNLNVAEKLTGSHKAIIKVPPMRSDEALLLLRERLGSSYDETAAADLIKCLECIPLAISQAAAYINRRCISINAYIQRFQDNYGQKMSLLRHDGGDIRRYESVSNSVAATWQVTFDQIRQESPAAANLLSLLSRFQSQNIPRCMLYGYNEAPEAGEVGRRDGESFEDDMDVLLAYSLTSRSAEPHIYEMHSLVQVCTQAWLSRLDCTAPWETLFLRLASEHFPGGYFESWRECQLLLPHVGRILEKKPEAEADIINWRSLLRNVSCYMMEKGDYDKAEVLAQKSVEVREELPGLDDPDTLTSMFILASIYRRQGRWKEAEKLGLQVVEASKTNLGADDPETLKSMANLGATYSSQGRWKEAEKLNLQVMEAMKMKLGEDHPHTLKIMANLASTYSGQGRWDEAEKLETHSLEARKTRLGVDHPDTLKSMANLASTYSSQGRWKEAEKLNLQVMEARKMRLGEDHPNTLVSMGNLALIYSSNGRWEEAEKLNLHVMEAMKTKLGEDHPDTLKSMHNLACTFKRRGRRQEAIELMSRCVSLHHHVLSQQHPDYTESKRILERWQKGSV